MKTDITQKFMQIAASIAELYALDARGRVWTYDAKAQGWRPLARTRFRRKAKGDPSCGIPDGPAGLTKCGIPGCPRCDSRAEP